MHDPPFHIPRPNLICLKIVREILGSMFFFCVYQRHILQPIDPILNEI